MKIDFNENGMTINFDKVPKFLYFNEESKGCGQVFLEGIRRKGLMSVEIKARTKELKICPPLKYRIEYIDMENCGASQFISNMKEELCINIKILDTKEFKSFLKCVKEIIDDERIPSDLRHEYVEKIISALHPNYIMDADSRIIDFGMEEKDND